jgi:hypothetical protein
MWKARGQNEFVVDLKYFGPVKCPWLVPGQCVAQAAAPRATGDGRYR